MECFKVNPHRMRGIGHAAVGKSIRGQKKAEFVVNMGLRLREDRQRRRAHSERHKTHNDDRKLLPVGQRHQAALE